MDKHRKKAKKSDSSKQESAEKAKPENEVLPLAGEQGGLSDDTLDDDEMLEHEDSEQESKLASLDIQKSTANANVGKPKRAVLKPPRTLETTLFDRLERMYGSGIKRMLTVQYRYVDHCFP